jgi:glycerol-3-phosphate cytidylyltransferase-like family protein
VLPAPVLVAGDVILDHCVASQQTVYGGAGRVAKVAAQLAPMTLLWPYEWAQMRFDQIGYRASRHGRQARGQHLPGGLGMPRLHAWPLGDPAQRTYDADGVCLPEQSHPATAPRSPYVRLDNVVRSMVMPATGVRCLVDHNEHGGICDAMLRRPDEGYSYTLLSTRRLDHHAGLLARPGVIIQWAGPPDGAVALPDRIDRDSGLLVTRGRAGADLYWGAAPPLRLAPQFHGSAADLPATGAGDVLTGVMAGMLARGESPAVAAQVGVYAASYAVTFGQASRPVLRVDGVRLPGPAGWRYWVKMARAVTAAPVDVVVAVSYYGPLGGNQLVYVPGCFDGTHAGHMVLLHDAARRRNLDPTRNCTFILAIPDDASIARIKGPGRPHQPFAIRAQGAVRTLLAAPRWRRTDTVLVLRYQYGDDVTWLERIGRKVDNIVKGDDYAGREVPGSQFAERVHLVPRLPGVSTTELAASGNSLRTV